MGMGVGVVVRVGVVVELGVGVEAQVTAEVGVQAYGYEGLGAKGARRADPAQMKPTYLTNPPSPLAPLMARD